MIRKRRSGQGEGKGPFACCGTALLNAAVSEQKHRGVSLHSPRCFASFTAVFFVIFHTFDYEVVGKVLFLVLPAQFLSYAQVHIGGLGVRELQVALGQ